MTQRKATAWLGISLALHLLVGCASPLPVVKQPDSGATSWSGRLALKVDADQASSFTAGFELKGNAQSGELSLYAPFGATVAQLSWTPTDARLRANGTEQSFDSLSGLVKHATGAELPIGSIFEWLAGRSAGADGWQADLRELPNGRLVARRITPAPALELRLVLE